MRIVESIWIQYDRGEEKSDWKELNIEDFSFGKLKEALCGYIYIFMIIILIWFCLLLLINFGFDVFLDAFPSAQWKIWFN